MTWKCKFQKGGVAICYLYFNTLLLFFISFSLFCSFSLPPFHLSFYPFVLLIVSYFSYFILIIRVHNQWKFYLNLYSSYICIYICIYVCIHIYMCVCVLWPNFPFDQLFLKALINKFQ